MGALVSIAQRDDVRQKSPSWKPPARGSSLATRRPSAGRGRRLSPAGPAPDRRPLGLRGAARYRTVRPGLDDHALQATLATPLRSPIAGAAAWRCRCSPIRPRQRATSCSAPAPSTAGCWSSTATSRQESTGHGSPLPVLVHGGPGRAGGSEEMGGMRGVKHYMQRTAIQSSPTMIAAITGQYMPGAPKHDHRHPPVPQGR